MTPQILLASGSVIYLMLGTLHLSYTFFTSRFSPYDQSVENAMKKTTPRITKETSLWNAWIGFNASHSSGAIFFAVITLYFAVHSFGIFKQSFFLQGVILLHSCFYLFLAKRYWFSIPFAGIALATVSYIVSIFLIYRL